MKQDNIEQFRIPNPEKATDSVRVATEMARLAVGGEVNLDISSRVENLNRKLARSKEEDVADIEQIAREIELALAA